MRMPGPWLTACTLAGAALGAGLAMPAHAQPADDAGRSAVGHWEMSDAERDRTCAVTLAPDTAEHGFAITFDAKCGTLFPFTRQVVAWRVGERGAIQFIDADAQTVLEISEVEGGLLEGERPDEGLLFLQIASVAALEERKPEQFVGEWTITQAGKPVCRITLTATPATPGTLVLRTKPGCGAAVARFGPVAWQFDRGQLVLLAQHGAPWRFEEGDSAAWQRIPETRPPMQLVRRP
jgi:hypothetical protein